MKKKFLTIITVVVLIMNLFTGCSGIREKKVSKSGFYFDTIITITLYGTEEESYITKCFSMASKYEKMFSNSLDNTDITKINENAGKKFVTVNDETIDLLNVAIDYGRKTNGKFDVTIGNLSDLWNFSEISKNTTGDNNETTKDSIPSHEEIKSCLEHIDYSKIVIKRNKVLLKDASSKIDLGGIAKGYIADKMKKYLVSEGITSGIINLGGNVLTIGQKSDNSYFSVGIQKPFDTRGNSICNLKISDKSVVSSGVYERYFTVDDKLYHHILDTTTGYPYNNGLYSVTIISDYSCDGDALSTSCFALGLENGMKLIENTKDTEAIFIDSDFNLYYSSGADEYIK